MPNIRFNEQCLLLREGETVLDGLLRHEIERPSSCRSGVCQSCMMKVVAGTPPAASQAGLKSAWKAQGYFLPCICKPQEDLLIADCAAQETRQARITRVEPLGPAVLRVLVEPDGEFQFEGGQFVNLVRPTDHLTRPYSIASTAAGTALELHVAVLPGGQMSNWLVGAEGASVQLRGPSGECFYESDSPEEPLLLVGTGTGLAPLLGVLRTALARGHSGPISLYRGSPLSSALYLREELADLALKHENLHVSECILANDGGLEGVRSEAIDAAVFSDLPTLNGYRIYLCGNPELVRKLKKKAFLAGASLQRIHSDPFVSAGGP